MSVRYRFLAALALVAALLPVSRSVAQLPPPPGKLLVSSTPSGANIVVNGQQRSETTNTSYLMAGGTYSIQVVGGPGNLSCNFPAVNVTSGSVVRVHCP